MAAHVIIDRRKNDKGKSSVNRQKFLQRVRESLREGAKDTVRDINIKDISKSGKKIKLPLRNLNEPTFEHNDSGIHKRIFTGNKEYVVGDKLPRPKSGAGSGGPKASKDGESVDDFEFTLTKDEFLDIFFENCQLPNMIRKSLSHVYEEENRRSGFRTDGSPATLNILRSMRQAKSRKVGLATMKQRKLKVLEQKAELLRKEIADLNSRLDLLDNSVDLNVLLNKQNELKVIEQQIEKLKKQIKAIPFLDPVDLRYNAWTKIQIPAIQAVMFCILDVSASMDELKKELAKTFFMLLYLFLERNYEHVEIVFVRHHTEAEIVKEEDFFYSRESGGTIVSSALDLVVQTIKEKYPLTQWNVYVAQGTDGDNFPNDNHLVKDRLINDILPITQYYAYAQINTEQENMWRSAPVGSDPYNMWMLFHELSTKHGNLGTGMIQKSEHVYNIFKRLFEKKPS